MHTSSSWSWMSCGLRGRDVDVMVIPRWDAARRIRPSDGSPSWYENPPSTYLHDTGAT